MAVKTLDKKRTESHVLVKNKVLDDLYEKIISRVNLEEAVNYISDSMIEYTENRCEYLKSLVNNANAEIVKYIKNPGLVSLTTFSKSKKEATEKQLEVLKKLKNYINFLLMI